MILDNQFHVPVLLQESIDALNIDEGKNYIDATSGGGGHSLEIIRRGGRLLAIDQDSDAVAYLKKRIEREGFGKRIGTEIFIVCDNFSNLKEIAGKFNYQKIAGIIFDLGISTNQLENSGRGFSYRKDEELDMRMSKESKTPVIDIINKFSLEDLYEVFSTYSEELHSRAIADAIVRARTMRGKILKTNELKDIILQKMKEINSTMDLPVFNKSSIKVMSRIFQALRIYVNDELNNLGRGLSQAIEILVPGGRLVVLSYHSLEDRMVKLNFRKLEMKSLIKPINKHPIIPSEIERSFNSKSRSAKLRIAEKV